MKNPTLATVLNIFPGLGYLYLGGLKRPFGFAITAVSVMGIISSFDPRMAAYYNDPSFTSWDILGLVTLIAIEFGFMYDAYVSAIEYNKITSKKK